jgi:hypothetical protein
MPGPFPGMDPYLEDSAGWRNVHHGLITYAQAALNRLLPPQYVASVDERLYVVQTERSIYPDLALVERPSPVPPQHGGGGTAVLMASDPAWVVTVLSEEVREGFIEIRLAKGGQQAITVIEVLSPSNKAPDSEGQRLYLTKQRELLQSQTHLIEIDLLRQGDHTAAPPVDYLIQQGYWDYLVSLHRGGQGMRFEVWPIPLRQRLPRIRVPLADGDPDLVLDLQAVLDRCYDEGALARTLDYRQAMPVPLSRADADWADQLLRERGLRE